MPAKGRSNKATFGDTLKQPQQLTIAFALLKVDARAFKQIDGVLCVHVSTADGEEL